MSRVNWIEAFDIGQSKARAEGRMLLLDFFNPN